MSGFSFTAKLVRPEGVGTWTYLNIPPEVSAAFGTKRQVRVSGTINGYPFRSTALPQGNGTHYLVVGKEIRDHIAASQGDKVNLVLEIDTEERIVEVPEELERALAGRSGAAETFEKMTYSHKKEWINWILSAKQEETRLRRLEKAVTFISQGKNLRDLSRRS